MSEHKPCLRIIQTRKMAEVRVIKDKTGKLRITFPYDPTYVKKIKEFEGSWWHPKEKYWTIPYSDGVVDKILSIFKGEKIELDPALQVTIQPKIKSSNQEQTIEAVKKELKLRGYKQKTRRAYLHHIP